MPDTTGNIFKRSRQLVLVDVTVAVAVAVAVAVLLSPHATVDLCAATLVIKRLAHATTVSEMAATETADRNKQPATDRESAPNLGLVAQHLPTAQQRPLVPTLLKGMANSQSDVADSRVTNPADNNSQRLAPGNFKQPRVRATAAEPATAAEQEAVTVPAIQLRPLNPIVVPTNQALKIC